MAVLTYKDIYEYDIKLYNRIRTEYADDSIAWHLFYKSYIDPDSYPIDKNGYKLIGGYKCTADGLLSIRRIYEKEGFGKSFLETYKRFRERPIFFFPCEWGGINQSRATLLEDRIDHALFDLKHYCDTKSNDCVLINAYQRPITQKWLKKLSFVNIVDALAIKGIFVNEDYEVYDLEKGKDAILTSLNESYSGIRSAQYMRCWSDDYYNNVKIKILDFYSKQNNKQN